VEIGRISGNQQRLMGNILENSDRKVGKCMHYADFVAKDTQMNYAKINDLTQNYLKQYNEFDEKFYGLILKEIASSKDADLKHIGKSIKDKIQSHKVEAEKCARSI
jgi:hypothetical protein